MKNYENICKSMKNKDFDALALEYRDENTTDRRRGDIVMIISYKYLPKVKRMAVGIVERDQDDYYQVYYQKIIYAIEKWKNSGAMFTSFLWQCIIGTRQEYLVKNYKKEMRATQIVYVNDWDEYDIEGLKDEYADQDWQYCKPSAKR